MNFERLRWGEWIAGIAGANLVLVTFRAWYEVTGTDVKISAWDALESGRYLLLVTGIIGIMLWLFHAAQDAAQRTLPMGAITAVAGLGCTVYIAYRLATPPADTLDAALGLYLGLLSALGVAVGGLLSVRESSETVPSYVPEDTAATAAPDAGPSAGLVPDSGGTWSPAPPTPAPNWTPEPVPAGPQEPAPGAAAVGDRPLQAGDDVVLTTGSARFPAGTVAQVVQVFGGGALVEVVAPDGMAERFEVPENAYDRAGGAGWSPGMPSASAPAAPAGTEDWGFDEGAGAGAAGAAAAGAALAGEDEPAAKAEKVPWWKREIGGGKKKKGAEADLAEAGAAGAAGALAATAIAGSGEDEAPADAEKKPGFFKRVFGGGKSDGAEAETAALTGAEANGTADAPEAGAAAEPDETAAFEPEASAPAFEPEASTAATEPEPTAAALEPEPPAAEPEPSAAAPLAAVPDPEPPAPEPVPPAPEPEPVASEPEPPAAEPPAPEPIAAEPEPEPPAPEPEPPAPEPEPPAPAPAPEPPAPEPEPEPVAAAPEPEAPAPEPEPEPEPEPPAPEPEPEPVAAEPEPPAPDPEPAAAEAAAAGAAGAAAASAADGDEEKPKPKRKRSSGARKVPKEAVAAASSESGPPKVGDAVELKMSGGKYTVGTRGTVVDVFSAGVIVELTDTQGRTERLDLPFEAVGPADA